MTRNELMIAQSKARSRIAGLYVVPFAVWPIAIAVYGHFERDLLERLSPVVHWALILGVLFGSAVVFWPVQILAAKIRARLGLNCPGFGHAMVGTLGMIVMATRSRGRCGRRVIDEDAQPIASHEPRR